jgi:uncharacterized protein YjbI with pentapeptide repeats
MKYFIAIIACFVAFSMNSQVDRVLVNGNQAHATLNLLELESIIETLQAQVAALQAAQASSFDGDYNSLTNQPAIPGNVSDLANDAGFTTFDGAYGNLTGAPTLATVATSGSYTDLSNQLTQKDIVESAYNLYGADLTVANLSNASLHNANLTGADLSNANLTGADLSGAKLTSADLSNADLSNASLYEAYLTGTDLSGADLSGVTWTGAYIKYCTGCTCVDADNDFFCDAY